MRAPRDHTAARRARPGALLGAAAAIAGVVGLVVGAAGGTHALWNDQITADLGIIQVGPGATEPRPPWEMTCMGGGSWLTLSFQIPEWAVGYPRFDMWLAGWNNPDWDPNPGNLTAGIGPYLAQYVDIDPVIGSPIGAEVLVTVEGDPSTVIAQGTVWFYRTDSWTVLVSCAAPLTAPQSATEEGS